ncbi:MAG TPA: inositol monophosphatase [Candidatus Limnocylindria bacterium]|jgi:myo-inositol-1(or 4)-monophosphatase|nr:inositol monophosphatase [Candidatus Limnocylindria bacterium]
MPEAAPKRSDRSRYEELARLAAETAVAVGDAIAIGDTAIVTRKRGRANFATAADHTAERTILARLAAHDPAIPVLAEESARKGIAAAERLWVVDPIDGTLNFSRGLPFYCVLIGYVEDGVARAAALHAPRTRDTFVASSGAGATHNGEPIHVSRVARLAEAFAVASLRFGETKRKDSRFVTLNSTCARLRVIGSAGMEIAYLAMGRFDLFVHEALSPWDIAGPALIAREAGAAVLSLRTGRDAAWDERQVVIANPTLAKDAIKLLAKLRM